MKPFREPPADAPAAPGRTWIEISLVDAEGRAIAGERFAIEMPDGSLAEGTTGPDGAAKLRGVPAGTCRISFPRLDAALWDRA